MAALLLINVELGHMDSPWCMAVLPVLDVAHKHDPKVMV